MDGASNGYYIGGVILGLILLIALVYYYYFYSSTSTSVETPDSTSSITVKTPGDTSTITTQSGSTTQTVTLPTPGATTTVSAPTPGPTTTVTVQSNVTPSAPLEATFSGIKAVPQRMVSNDPAYGPVAVSGNKLFQSLLASPYVGGFTKDEATSFCTSKGGVLPHFNSLMPFYNLGYHSAGEWGWTSDGPATYNQVTSIAGYRPGATPSSKYGVYCMGQPNSSYTGKVFTLP